MRSPAVLSISDLETLRQAYSPSSELTPAEGMRQIGNPPIAELVAYAVAQVAHPDRNRRVLALRILQHQRGQRAMRGLLAGLSDQKRRVCAAAIQACPNYLEYGEIVERLEAIAQDAALKRKLRARALSMLAGDQGRGELTPATAEALRRLLPQDQYRFSIVFGLARLELQPLVEQLLEECANSTHLRERALARRALGGERIIHIDAYAEDEAAHQRIMETCDIAHGRMFYWLPRAGLQSPTPQSK